MSDQRRLRCYEYVNRPYEQVREALSADAGGIFHRATTAAASRALSLATTLRVQVGSVEVGADVEIEVGALKESHRPASVTPVAELPITWRARRSTAMFPTMEATLSFYPLSSSETQMDLHGQYTPPLGAVGAALDAVLMHRIAEASVHRFLDDVVERLKLELPAE